MRKAFLEHTVVELVYKYEKSYRECLKRWVGELRGNNTITLPYSRCACGVLIRQVGEADYNSWSIFGVWFNGTSYICHFFTFVFLFSMESYWYDIDGTYIIVKAWCWGNCGCETSKGTTQGLFTASNFRGHCTLTFYIPHLMAVVLPVWVTEIIDVLELFHLLKPPNFHMGVQ